MNVLTKSTRLAATGAVTALAAATLVGATTTAANADPVVNNSYLCSAAGQNFPLFLTTNAPGIEAFPEIGAGTDLPGGLLSVTNTFTIPAAVHTFMTNAGVTDVSAPTFSGAFGSSTVGVEGVTVTMAGFTEDEGGATWSSDDTDTDGDAVEGTGVNSAFEVPAAGEYDILSPATLDLVATLGGGGEIPVTCTIAEGTTPGAYHHIIVNKNESTVAGTPVAKTLKTTKVAKMKVTVTAAQMPTGDVIVKEGKKKLGSGTLNDLGKVTVKMGMLKKGKHDVKVIYKGDGYDAKASTPVSFTVKAG